MQYRELGNTGQKVSLLGLGGEATVQEVLKREEAEKIINRALDSGVNYLDTSPQYGSGGSEENIGRVMAYRRRDAFLATKTHARTYDGTMELVEKSLHRLQTDYLDLYQIHNLQEKEEINQIFGQKGALKALLKLREQGVIRSLGITAHKNTQVLLKAMEEFEFDCVLMSLNVADSYRDSFKEKVLPRAQEKNMGIIAMKVTAVGRLLQNGRFSMSEVLGYVFNLPVSTVIVGTSTINELEENIEIAGNFKKLQKEKISDLEKRARNIEEEGNFFKIYW